MNVKITETETVVLLRQRSEVLDDIEAEYPGCVFVSAHRHVNIKNLLDKMGGCIWLESRVDEGSVFSFELPFGMVDEQALQEAQSEQASMLAEQSLQRMKVLVVDDSEVNRMVLTTFLGQHGIGFREADSGEAALALMSEEPFEKITGFTMEQAVALTHSKIGLYAAPRSVRFR